MNWIRIAVGIQDDPKLATLADALRVKLPHAVGLMVCTLVQLPDHAIDGDLSRVPDTTLERWAGWHGKAGAFAKAFRATFCTNGVLRSWERHNGAPIRRAIRNGEDKRQERDRRRVSADVIPDGGSYETNETNETRRDGFAVAVQRDSEKQLHQLPPTRTTRAKRTDAPSHVASVIGSIDAEWVELMRKADGRIA